jgi:hypothetical protein
MKSTDDPISQDLHALEEETRDRCWVNLNDDGSYANVLKGCFIKCFEFAILVRVNYLDRRVASRGSVTTDELSLTTIFSRGLEPKSHVYFLAPALRGLHCAQLPIGQEVPERA